MYCYTDEKVVRNKTAEANDFRTDAALSFVGDRFLSVSKIRPITQRTPSGPAEGAKGAGKIHAVTAAMRVTGAFSTDLERETGCFGVDV
jgi:hypothetical protein